MGWLFHNQKLRHETPVQYITRELSHESEAAKATVLAAATVRGTIYAAVRNEDKTTGKTYVFCAVILFKNSERSGFGYKDMDESCGPCEVDCPDRILRLLSPVDELPNPGYAVEWRARVAEKKVQDRRMRQSVGKLVPGDIIRLPHAVSFRASGVTADRFRFLGHYKRTSIFEPIEYPGLRCRLRRDTLAAATIER